MKLPANLTIDMICDAVEQDDCIGFCISCGEESETRCEPDAREYKCHNCDKNSVYGAEELLIMFG